MQGDLKQERIRQDRQRTGEGDSKHYKQVSHGATLIFDDVFYSTSTHFFLLEIDSMRNLGEHGPESVKHGLSVDDIKDERLAREKNDLHLRIYSPAK